MNDLHRVWTVKVIQKIKVRGRAGGRRCCVSEGKGGLIKDHMTRDDDTVYGDV
jgi:hypothetical protein